MPNEASPIAHHGWEIAQFIWHYSKFSRKLSTLGKTGMEKISQYFNLLFRLEGHFVWWAERHPRKYSMIYPTSGYRRDARPIMISPAGSPPLSARLRALG